GAKKKFSQTAHRGVRLTTQVAHGLTQRASTGATRRAATHREKARAAPSCGRWAQAEKFKG
ncbi:hypothetical protein HAX54_050614, partial [Datura stramonium]|nr:hypothetical protein [Datura stramonium]